MTTDSPAVAPKLDLNSLSRAQKVSGGAMAAVVAGAFLPWVSFLGFSVIGVRGDGLITLIAAVVGLAALAFGTDVLGRRRIADTTRTSVSAVAAGISVLVAFTDMNNFAAAGLYVTLMAGIAWVVGLVWEANEAKVHRNATT